VPILRQRRRLGYSECAVQKSWRLLGVFSLFGVGAAVLAIPQKPVWPLTLREGLPTALPGWTPAPKDDLPEEDENEMGKYVEVSRFFQRIESPTLAKQFRVVIQDYGERGVIESIRRAVAEAKKSPGVEARDLEIGGRKAFAVTDRSGPHPTTLVTVVVTPSRLVLGQGANVAADEAIALIKQVDLARVATVTH
jgi:hypothetical protein